MEKQWSASFERVREKEDVSMKIRSTKIRGVISIAAAAWLGWASASTSVGNNLGKSPSPAAVSAPPQFETERVVSAQETQGAKVGDQLLFRVKGAHFPGIQAVSDNKESLEAQGWALVEANPRDNETDLTLAVVPLKAGKRIFPALALQDPAGKVLGRTTPVPVEILSAISPSDPKPDQPEDVQPPAGLRFPLWLVILAGILGVGLVGLLCYSFYRALKERVRRRIKPEQVLSEDERALAELLRLDELQLLKKREFKRHYFRISEILKNYVGDRYQFDALESTTGEMIEALQGRRSAPVMAGEVVISNLSLLFEELDRVKFTDHAPELEEFSQITEKARGFIVNTRRAPVILSAASSFSGDFSVNGSKVDNHANQ